MADAAVKVAKAYPTVGILILAPHRSVGKMISILHPFFIFYFFPGAGRSIPGVESSRNQGGFSNKCAQYEMEVKRGDFL